MNLAAVLDKAWIPVLAALLMTAGSCTGEQVNGPERAQASGPEAWMDELVLMCDSAEAIYDKALTEAPEGLRTPVIPEQHRKELKAIYDRINSKMLLFTERLGTVELTEAERAHLEEGVMNDVQPVRMKVSSLLSLQPSR